MSDIRQMPLSSVITKTRFGDSHGDGEGKHGDGGNPAAIETSLSVACTLEQHFLRQVKSTECMNALHGIHVFGGSSLPMGHTTMCEGSFTASTQPRPNLSCHLQLDAKRPHPTSTSRMWGGESRESPGTRRRCEVVTRTRRDISSDGRGRRPGACPWGRSRRSRETTRGRSLTIRRGRNVTGQMQSPGVVE